MIKRVTISKRARKELLKVPEHIARNLKYWIEAVETDGIEEVRKVPGYHDEPLHGQRFGQRSIRLSRYYRAIYEIKSVEVEFVSVEEVSKHQY
jgi:proteic killer suppression protein